jgi:histone-binding protein RBBP4
MSFLTQFVHGGHTDRVADISWNSNNEWFMASAADNNILQVWQLACNIYDEEGGDEEGGDEDLE